ncbi:MAG: ATP-binding protein, partial [Gammaproteobacteria bacterium]|nr:ATP-binding protein [Gammaproteobacteria bacterium]
ILSYGFSVVVDATFLAQCRRLSFQALAQSQNTPFVIMDIQADPDRLKQRILQRQQQANNPSEATIAIMQQQLMNREPLSAEEQHQAWPLIAGDEESWKQFRIQLTNLVK